MNDRADRVPGFDDASDHLRARDVLARAGYSEEGVRAALDSADLLKMQGIDIPPALRRTRAGTTLDTLARLFFLGVRVEVDAARRALHPMPLESWVGANLLELRDGQVEPLVKLLAYRGLRARSPLDPGGQSGYILARCATSSSWRLKRHRATSR